MGNIFKNWTSEKKILILKVCTAVSFLLIVSPAIGASYDLMAIHLVKSIQNLFKVHTRYFGFFNVLEILYCVSLIYLIGFSYTAKKMTNILVLVALCLLSIPGVLDALFLIFANSYFNLSIITIALFFFFAVNLFAIYRKRLKNN